MYVDKKNSFVQYRSVWFYILSYNFATKCTYNYKKNIFDTVGNIIRMLKFCSHIFLFLIYFSINNSWCNSFIHNIKSNKIFS